MSAEDDQPEEVEETEEVDEKTGAVIKRRVVRKVQRTVVTTKTSEPQTVAVAFEEDQPEDVEETEEIDEKTGAVVKRRVVRKIQQSVVTTKTSEPIPITVPVEDDQPEEVEETEEVDEKTGAVIKRRTVRKVQRSHVTTSSLPEAIRSETNVIVVPEDVEETVEVDEETGAVTKRRTIRQVQTSVISSQKSDKKTFENVSDKPESDQYLMHTSESPEKSTFQVGQPSMSSLPSKVKKEIEEIRDGCASASGSLVSEISRKGSNSTISEISETSFQISTGLIDQVFPSVENEFSISLKDFDLGLSGSSSMRKDSSSSTISQASESIRKISSECESRKVSSTSVRSRKTSGESVTFSRDHSSPVPIDDLVRSSPRREHSSPLIESRRKLSSLSEDGSVVSETSEIIGGRRVVRRTIVTQVIQTYEDDDEDGEWKLVSEEAKVETFPGDLPEGSVKRTSFSGVPESLLPTAVLDRPAFITDARVFDHTSEVDAVYSATESEHSSLNYQDEPGVSARSHYAYSEHIYSGTESEQSSLQYVNEQIESSEAQTAMHIDFQNGNDNDDINSNSSGGGLTPGHVDDNRQRTLSVSSHRSDSSPQATSSPSRGGVDFDPVASWGKPLGLPTPLPPEDNQNGFNSSKKVNSPLPNSPAKMTSRKSATPKRSPPPIYVDLAYVPHHGNPDYCDVEYFKRIRARNYVFSGVEPSMKVFNALLEAKMQWEGDDKNLDVTIIPTYDSDSLGTWVANHEDILARNRIDLAPSASRCTINLQDYDSACSAYRLEF